MEATITLLQILEQLFDLLDLILSILETIIGIFS